MNSIVYLIILASPLFSDGICHVYYDNGNFMLRKFLFVNDNIIVSDVCRIFNQQKIKKGNYTMLPVKIFYRAKRVTCNLDKSNLIIIIESLDQAKKSSFKAIIYISTSIFESKSDKI